MEFGDEGQSLARLTRAVDAARECGFAADLGKRPLPVPDAVARRADGARRGGRALRLDGARDDRVARLAARAGSARKDARRAGRPLRRARRGRGRPRLVPARLRPGRRSVRRPLAALRRGRRGAAGSAAARSPLAPAPRREGGIPLWLGSWGSDAGLRRVARLGDGWFASAYNTTPEVFGVARESLAAELRARGSDPGGFPTRW